MEVLFRKEEITLRDINSVYESLFLRAVIGFELFCDGLFFSILDGSVRYSSRRALSMLSARSGKAARRIVLGTRNYLDWIPYDKMSKTVRVYLRDGKPFTNLDDKHDPTVKLLKDSLETIVIIRNAIAHESASAIRKFESAIGRRNLRPRERTPGAYLRSNLSIAPPQTRFQGYIADLGAIAALIMDRPLT
jgi:hypothetical protein